MELFSRNYSFGFRTDDLHVEINYGIHIRLGHNGLLLVCFRLTAHICKTANKQKIKEDRGDPDLFLK